ncbi:FAD/NAD(P)-binding protein [Smaragdicoccus niigatensis]
MSSTDSVVSARWPIAAEAMLPTPFRVVSRAEENHDSATLLLEPISDRLPPYAPGQFSMISAFGVGEIAVSISGDTAVSDGRLTHTIRAVGAVSAKLHAAQPGAVIGVRGPCGHGWRVDAMSGRDLVIVAGGVGLAPLRPVLFAALAQRNRFGRIILIAGARTAEDFLFRAELAAWTHRADLEMALTVDRPTAGWRGGVGFVTEPLGRLRLDPQRTSAVLCGPEPMMRFCAQTLLRKGIASADIEVSLERNMQCGIGLCGHCQLGPLLVCRDGPVVDYGVAGPLFAVEEL